MYINGLSYFKKSYCRFEELNFLEEYITLYCNLLINIVKKCMLFEKSGKRTQFGKFQIPIILLFTDLLLLNLLYGLIKHYGRFFFCSLGIKDINVG